MNLVACAKLDKSCINMNENTKNAIKHQES